MGCACPDTERLSRVAQGGHEANLVCSRPGTHVLEMACPGYIWWWTSAKVFMKALKLTHVYQSVAGNAPCNLTQMNWDSAVRPSRFLVDSFLETAIAANATKKRDVASPSISNAVKSR